MDDEACRAAAGVVLGPPRTGTGRGPRVHPVPPSGNVACAGAKQHDGSRFEIGRGGPRKRYRDVSGRRRHFFCNVA